MVVQFVKFKSTQTMDEKQSVMHERMGNFRALPGLIQKYYCFEESTGEVAGIYFWDSMESLNEFKQSELAQTIASAYKAESDPRVEILEVMEILRS